MSQTHAKLLPQIRKFSHNIDSTGDICYVLKCVLKENKCVWNHFCALLLAIATPFHSWDDVNYRFGVVFPIYRKISHSFVFTKIAPNPSRVALRHTHLSIKVIYEVNNGLFRQKLHIIALCFRQQWRKRRIKYMELLWSMDRCACVHRDDLCCFSHRGDKRKVKIRK